MSLQKEVDHFEEKFAMQDSDLSLLKPKERDLMEQEIISGAKTGHPIEIIKLKLDNDVPKVAELLSKYEDTFDVQILVFFLYRFLNTPLVLDKFDANDSARDDWSDSIVENHGKAGYAMINRNRLRANIMSESASVIKAIADYLNSSELQAIVNTIPFEKLENTNYKSLPFAEKMKLVQLVTGATQEALRVLNQK